MDTVTKKELDEKSEQREDIIFEVMRLKHNTNINAIKSEIITELSSRLGIDENYFVIEAENND